MFNFSLLEKIVKAVQKPILVISPPMKPPKESVLQQLKKGLEANNLDLSGHFVDIPHTMAAIKKVREGYHDFLITGVAWDEIGSYSAPSQMDRAGNEFVKLMKPRYNANRPSPDIPILIWTRYYNHIKDLEEITHVINVSLKPRFDEVLYTLRCYKERKILEPAENSPIFRDYCKFMSSNEKLPK
tara:strand:- start:2337 stop:2891 length:555 start_codon:yes stop_codon:yes gene_type:complete